MLEFDADTLSYRAEMFTIMERRAHRKVYSVHDVDGNTYALKSRRLQRKGTV